MLALVWQKGEEHQLWESCQKVLAVQSFQTKMMTATSSSVHPENRAQVLSRNSPHKITNNNFTRHHSGPQRPHLSSNCISLTHPV
jgi:hypothetical protein